MKDQATRLLDAIDNLGGDTQGWRQECVEQSCSPPIVTCYWVIRPFRTGRTTDEATPTEIKALVWELFLILMKFGDEPIHTPDSDNDLWGWDSTAKLVHDPIEAAILAAEKVSK